MEGRPGTPAPPGAPTPIDTHTLPRVRYKNVYRVHCPFCGVGISGTEDAATARGDATRPAGFRLDVLHTPPAKLAAGVEVYILTCPGCKSGFVARWAVANAERLERGKWLAKENPVIRGDERYKEFFVARMSVQAIGWADFMAEVESIGNRFVRERVKRELMARGIVLPWGSVQPGLASPKGEESTEEPPPHKEPQL